MDTAGSKPNQISTVSKETLFSGPPRKGSRNLLKIDLECVQKTIGIVPDTLGTKNMAILLCCTTWL